MPTWLIGVDGGGTATRVRVADAGGCVVAEGRAGPSALGQGAAQAWRHVAQAVGAAFAAAGQAVPVPEVCALGLGLAGAVSAERRDGFLALLPGYAAVSLATDADVALLGALGGAPGVLLAAGTGSVGEVLNRRGERRAVGGWGFPVGDEGSGAWLGLRAMRVAQCASDGRAPAGPLAEAVWRAVHHERQALLEWCIHAGQHEYAALAPCVFDTEATDRQSRELLHRAVNALEDMATALDPDGGLPLVVTGSIGERLAARLHPTLRARRVQPQGDACDGALALVRARVATAAAR